MKSDLNATDVFLEENSNLPEMILKDLPAERAVLASIFKYGGNAYFDVADIISENTFTIDSNATIFKCLKTILERDSNSVIDIPSIYSTAESLDLGLLFKKNEEVKHLQAIATMPVMLANARKFAAIIRKLEITRLLVQQLDYAKENLLNVKGNEPVTQILGIAENSILDFTSLLNNTQDEDPKRLVRGLTEYLTNLADNPITQMGLSSGYPMYDAAIGGGFRRGSVNLIGGRAKSGKSLISLNIGNHVAQNLTIPVLYLDTEMLESDHKFRLMARLTETPVNDIETGQFGKSMFARKAVLDMAKKVEKLDIPIDHKNVSGKPFEEILSIARRWLIKVVGLNDDGTAKNCLIIYDYIKLMSSENLSADLKEYQLLGFMMTGLHNFAVRYSLPILALIQLNRDGINKEGAEVAAGSDRVIWLCSNFSIYKRKSDEEIAEHGIDGGNRKLVPIVSRHGPGLSDGDYINMNMVGKYCKITEGKTAFEQKNEDEGFVSDNSSEEIPFE